MSVFDPAHMPTVVGLDPSLTASGIAWPGGQCTVVGESGISLVEPISARGLRLMELTLSVVNALLGLTPGAWNHMTGRPHLVVMEELPREHLDTERAYLWWSLVNLLGRNGVAVIRVQPSTIKKFMTGKGNVGKAAVIDAVARRMPQFATGGNDNKADAAVLCAIGMDLLGFPIVETRAADWGKGSREKLIAAVEAAGVNISSFTNPNHSHLNIR